MHRVSGLRKEKKKNKENTANVDALDSIDSCLLERRRKVLRCGRKTLELCVVHVHNLLKWDSACRELRVMSRTCLALQVDIVCGDGNQAWYFRSRQ